MSRRTARHAKPSRARAAVVPAAVGGALLLPALPALASSPSPAPAAASSSEVPPLGYDAAATRELLRLVNGHRTGLGLPALTPDAGLARQAVRHSREMAEAHRLYHADELFTRAVKRALGMRLVGENVAYAGDTAVAHQALLDSPHHREILETATYRRVGVAVVDDGRGAVYVTEDFGVPVAAPARRAAAPAAAAPVVGTPSSRPAPPAPAVRRTALPEAALPVPAVRAPVAVRVPATSASPTPSSPASARAAAPAPVAPAVRARTVPRQTRLFVVSAEQQAKMTRHLRHQPAPAVLAAQLRVVVREAQPVAQVTMPVRARAAAASTVRVARVPEGATLPALPTAAAAALLGLVAASVVGTAGRSTAVRGGPTRGRLLPA